MVMIPNMNKKGKKGKGNDLSFWIDRKPTTPSDPLQNQINNAEKRIQYVGGELPKTDDQPWYLDVLDFIQRPQRMVTGALAEGTKQGSDVWDVLGAGWKGISGQEKRDFDEVLSNLGWEDKKGFGLHDVASFVGDVALDPLTYLSFGAAAAAKTGGKGATKAANQLVGLSVPFSGKEVTLLNKPKTFQRAASVAQPEQLAKIANAANDLNIPDVTKTIFNKPLQNVTMEEAEYLTKHLDDLLGKTPMQAPMKATDASAFTIGERLGDGGKNVFDQLFKSNVPSDLAKRVQKNPFVDTGKYLQPSKARQVFDESLLGRSLNDFVGRTIGGSRYVDPLLLRQNPMLRQGVDLAHDNAMEIRGLQQQLIDDLANKLTKDFGLDETTRKMIAVNYDDPQKLKALLQQRPDLKPVTDYVQKFFADIAKKEGDLGILKGTRDNYLPLIFRKGDTVYHGFDELPPQIQQAIANSTTHGFAKERKTYDTLQQAIDAIENNPVLKGKITVETDLAKLMGLRGASSVKAVQNQKMFQQLQDMGFVTTNDKGGVFRKVNVQGSDLPIYAHDEIATHIEQINNLFSSDKYLKNTVRGINKVQNLWKKYVTSAIPAHHFRNLLGNLWNNQLAGISYKSYDEAAQLLTGKKVNPQLMDEAVKRGIVKQGFFGADLNETIEQAVDFATRKSNLAQIIPDTMRRYVGEPTENWSRLAHFVDVYNKTGSFDIASESTRKYLFNYFELSPTERSIRAFIPFYTWMRNNIPLQMEQLVKNPKYSLGYKKLQEESQGEDILPEWMQGNYMKVPFTQDTYFNPYLPYQDLENLSPKQFGANLVNSVSPFVKSPFELLANKQFFTGAPIDRYDDGQVDVKAYLDYLFGQTGLPKKVADTGQAITSGNQQQSINEVLGVLFGKPRQMDQEKQQYYQQLEYEKQLREVIKRLKAQGIDVPSVRDIPDR